MFDWQILKLQDQVVSITANYSNKVVTLNDICLKPLAPDNNNCTILSVVNYFQNNETKIDEEVWINDHFSLGADYHDHLISCTRYVSSILLTSSMIHVRCFPVVPPLSMTRHICICLVLVPMEVRSSRGSPWVVMMRRIT